MKILRISLRNLASLAGTHTVDFTREPLRTAGLFAISGLTGSGKSTLLDALCLALYEKTPRLHAVRGAVKLADGAASISQKDPGNLLRRGTGEGFAEVAFLGVDDRAYTARWTVRRARSRPDGALQNTEMTLFQGDLPPGANGALEQGGRKTEVLPVIAAKVGLSFEQFTRAVLLAQNDFATFLKADDTERAEILQALTGTARFEAISIAVFERSSAEQRTVAELENRLTGNAPLAPEARAEAEAAVAAVETELKDAAEKLAAHEAHAAWFARRAELARHVEDAERKLDDAKKAREAAAPRRLDLQHTEQASREARPLWEAERRLIAETTAAETARDKAASAATAARTVHEAKKQQHEQTAAAVATAKSALDTAQPALRLARELDARLTPLAERLAQATRERAAAEASVKDAAQRRDQLYARRATAAQEQTQLAIDRTALADYVAFAPEATAWLDRLDRAAAARHAGEIAEKRVAEKVKQARDKEAAVAAERARELEIRQTAAQAAAACEKAEGIVRAHDGAKIAAERRAAEAARAALHALRDHLRAEELHTEIDQLKASAEADTGLLADLRQRRIPAAATALEAARRSFELAQAAISDSAVALREQLVAEKPCPVCGALDHPYAGHAPTGEGAVLRVLREDCAAREKEAGELRSEAARLDAAGPASARRLGKLQRALAALIAAGQPCLDHPVAAAILALPPAERTTALDTRLATASQTLTALASADEARLHAESQREACRKTHDATAAQLAELTRKLSALAEELARRHAERQAAEEARDHAASIFEHGRAELSPLLTRLADAEAAWERDPTAFRATFAERTQAASVLEKRSGELANVLRETDAALHPILEAVMRAETVCAERRSEETKAHTAYQALRDQRAGIFGGRPADDVERDLAETLRRTTVERDNCAEALGHAGRQLAASAETLRGASQTLAATLDRRGRAVAALDTWLAGFAASAGRPLSRADLEKLLARDDAWVQAERLALDALDGAIRKAEGVFSDRQKTLTEHTARRPTEDDEPTVAAALGALRLQRDGIAKRGEIARAHLVADDLRIRENAALAGQLAARRGAAEPWLKLNELIGSANGAKFRGIAQRRTLDLLLGYANAQLDQLAARYRLERLPESLNLIVVDRDMGDERRSVHSLSGGESFLVSLALALALASLTSNRLRIESLFIDEGFGSLDPETLNTAMNALMHLEAQGRKVGVISHVTEMTDAIPVQIRVIKGRSGASRLVVPGAVDELTPPRNATMPAESSP